VIKTKRANKNVGDFIITPSNGRSSTGGLLFDKRRAQGICPKFWYELEFSVTIEGKDW
jgi:hypothetical protein